MAGATAWHLAACFLLLALRQHGQAQPSAPSNATAGLNTTLAAQEGGTKPELPIETGQTPPWYSLPPPSMSPREPGHG